MKTNRPVRIVKRLEQKLVCNFLSLKVTCSSLREEILSGSEGYKISLVERFSVIGVLISRSYLFQRDIGTRDRSRSQFWHRSFMRFVAIIACGTLLACSSISRLAILPHHPQNSKSKGFEGSGDETSTSGLNSVKLLPMSTRKEREDVL